MLKLMVPIAAASIAILSGLSLGQNSAVIQIDPGHPQHPISRFLTGACIEDVNHEIYGGLYSQMIFGESFQEPAMKPKAPLPQDIDGQISGMWSSFNRGGAVGTASLGKINSFVGSQFQSLNFTKGDGEFGIENRGLNRQGMSLLANRNYKGHLWARAQSNAPARVALASADGSHIYATVELAIADANWHRYDFELVPNATDIAGRFEISLVSSGSVDFGYAFLEPGAWGTFKGLPVRRDIAEALIDEGVTAMRYGGSMVNTDEYRWKKMIGDRDHRPPYHGIWYNYSSNGWGIVDFLNFCDGAGFLPVPDFNINESPEDMVDFLEYANGPVNSAWGAKRAADGHPAPYHLTHIELGNEERVDEVYAAKFELLARAIWAKDPNMVLTIGDFSYNEPITDPMHFEGAASHITTLWAHQQILKLARQFNAEVWFDIHLWTDDLPKNGWLDPFPTYVDSIDHLADGAKHHVVVFELNANNHGQRRALASALTLLQIEHDGRIPFVSSANCLQVDHQNDNGWDQGLLFLNPAQVWLQPPGYALQILSRYYQPTLVDIAVQDDTGALTAAATLSEDRKTVTLQIVNAGDASTSAKINIVGWVMDNAAVTKETVAGLLSDVNTAQHPRAIFPATTPAGQSQLPAHSLTLLSWHASN